MELVPMSRSFCRYTILLRLLPPIRHLTGRFIGMGVRPERVRSPGLASGARR